VANMLVEMELRLEACRYLIMNGAWRAERQDFSDPTFFSKAKVLASEASFECARLATEIFGGRGIMADDSIERYLRDATANLHDFGSNQIHRLRVATTLGYDPSA
jgi:alkylation response protein AidB-like acyl-CoA dehydrogenase